VLIFFGNLIVMKKVIYILMLLPLTVSAQFEAKQWYFGDGAGVDFVTGQASAFNHYTLYSASGSTTMSDCNGSLLFYSNGEEVKNANHQLISNGILDGSSALSVLAVPWPGQNKIYYLFYMRQTVDSTSLLYAIVDMNAAGGNIVVKDILLGQLTCNKLAAVHQSNNSDFWLVTHSYRNNEFHSYSISTAGLSLSPVISAAGPVINLPADREGSLSFSIDGKKMINVLNNGHIGIYNFNRSTASVSLSLDLSSLGIANPFGAAFSPSAKKLYITSRLGQTIWQMDVASGNMSSIAASKVVMDQLLAGQFADMQLALNGKLYIAIGISTRLAEIANPDLSFPDCAYQRYGLFLNGNSCNFGLPHFVQTFFNVPFNILSDNHCTSQPVNLTLFPESENVSTQWIFDNGITVNSTDTFHADIVASTGGDHIIHTIATYQCGTEIITDTFSIDETPDPAIGNDTSVCPGDYIGVTISSPGNIIWSDGSTENYRELFIGNYIVTVDNNGCKGSDEITIQSKADKEMMLKWHGELCSDYNRYPLLEVKHAVSSTWFPENINALQYNATLPGIYWVESSDSAGCIYSDSVLIEQHCPVVITFPSSFTPNNDGINDVFNCYAGSSLTGSMSIYNRGGKIVFSTTDLTKGWDGSFNGKDCPQGIYGCLVKFSDESGNEVMKQVSVVLIR
jgi:gliding motility-associated-like protein